jgi:hypothetical protein
MRVATIEAGISLAENPSIAVDYIANGATELTVMAKDTNDPGLPTSCRSTRAADLDYQAFAPMRR